MSQWIVLVVIAQFINAIVAIIDKYLVSSKRVGNPITYTFYIGILSSLSILVFLFGSITIPLISLDLPSFSNIAFISFKELILLVVVSVSFLGALVTLFSAFRDADTSDVVPVVGSVAAIFTLGLSTLLLGSVLTGGFIWGFILLIVGMLMVSHFRFSKKTAMYSIIAGALFGLNIVTMKLLFLETNFDNAFFWSRIGIALFALLLLFKIPKKTKTKGGKTSSWAIILGNKVLAGIAGLLILKAIDVGDVPIVQALGGLQFLFLLVFALFLGNKTPYSCGDNCTKRELVQKIISVIIISIGFAFLFI
ncbi:MAG: putative membrane protein [Candidatus Paceibacteria bacterium]|jgi:uncharacterized membrane protein